MTLIETAPVGLTPAEQVYEIKSMAESGQFADALIRLRKLKPQYPRNTFLVALEKQLERLLVLPRDSESTETQKKELLASLSGLIKGAVESLRQQSSARPQQVQPPAPVAKPERSERDAARTQLKEQYFQHADEYLKKGAYGSALVEIRRVKIIAPDDPTVMEYERTIRQLVELQQRTGIRTQEADQNAPAEVDSPRTGVEASPTSAPPVRDVEPVTIHPAPADSAAETLPARPVRPKSRATQIALAIIGLVGLSITALALFSNPDETVPAESHDQGMQTVAPEPIPVTAQAHVPASDLMQTGNETRNQEKTEPPREPLVPTPVVTTEPNVPPTALAQETETPKPVSRQSGSDEQKTAAPAASPREKPATKPEPATPATATTPAFTETDPQILHLEQPVFPPETLGSANGAEIIIMVQIDPQGKPVKTLVAKSTNTLYNAPIIAAVMNSTYRPGTTPAGPATKWITIPFKIK